MAYVGLPICLLTHFGYYPKCQRIRPHYSQIEASFAPFAFALMPAHSAQILAKEAGMSKQYEVFVFSDSCYVLRPKNGEWKRKFSSSKEVLAFMRSLPEGDRARLVFLGRVDAQTEGQNPEKRSSKKK
jgi:hypothetical protein